MVLLFGESTDASPLAPGAAAGRSQTPPSQAAWSSSPCGGDAQPYQEVGARESSLGYMRIQGELLKLGISVSATTVATVLRASGLGPAPRRIGPSWSEFLRAQAQSLVGGRSSSAVQDDSLDGDAAEPGGRVQDAGARQLEADCDLSSAEAGQPRLASFPPPERSRSAFPRVVPATRGPLRLQPAHRWHARDGPPRAGRRTSHSPALRRDVKVVSVAPRVRANHRIAPLARAPWDLQPRHVGASERPLSPEPPARTEFLYP